MRQDDNGNDPAEGFQDATWDQHIEKMTHLELLIKEEFIKNEEKNYLKQRERRRN
jgi:hypothetical protein